MSDTPLVDWKPDSLCECGHTKMPERPNRMAHGEFGMVARPDGPFFMADEASGHFDMLEALIRTLTAERDAGVEKGIRMAAEVAFACDFPRAPEGSNQNSYNAALGEYRRRILALIPQPEEVKVIE